jgi:hypothetical protein
MPTLSQERWGFYALARPFRPGEGKGDVCSRRGKKVEIAWDFRKCRPKIGMMADFPVRRLAAWV